jgi:hypothetical protein
LALVTEMKMAVAPNYEPTAPPVPTKLSTDAFAATTPTATNAARNKVARRELKVTPITVCLTEAGNDAKR